MKIVRADVITAEEMEGGEVGAPQDEGDVVAVAVAAVVPIVSQTKVLKNIRRNLLIPTVLL
jgi:hypothetical protein